MESIKSKLAALLKTNKNNSGVKEFEVISLNTGLNQFFGSSTNSGCINDGCTADHNNSCGNKGCKSTSDTACIYY